ncbi:Tachykinin-like peptides receptor 86C [Halotydeus destructor]|nr:Tachykinin-like peptides receptor 86C [Halotydeus destructor]
MMTSANVSSGSGFELFKDCLMSFSDWNETSNYLLDSSLENTSYIEQPCPSNSTSGEKANPYVMPLWAQLVWSIAFGSMVSVSVMGNLIVIWIVVAHRNMRTVTNFFLLNLTLADLMMATFNAIFNFVYMLHSHWPFGGLYCLVSNFIATLTVSSSVFTITATSIDRYIAVVHPLKQRMSRKTAVIIILVIWFCASLLALPNLLYSRVVEYKYGQDLRIVCYLHWPDGWAGQSTMDYSYNIVLLVLTYAIPMASMAIFYSLMGNVLWGSKGIGEESVAQRDAVRSKQKVARMLITVVAIFAICWLPYHGYFLYTYYVPGISRTSYIQYVYLGIYWLAMSHSMYNPIIYCWMNKRFRSYFAQILLCCRNQEYNMSVNGNGSSRKTGQPPVNRNPQSRSTANVRRTLPTSHSSIPMRTCSKNSTTTGDNVHIKCQPRASGQISDISNHFESRNGAIVTTEI